MIIHKGLPEVFISNGKKGKESRTAERQTERERERESVCVCVCVCVRQSII